MPRIHPISITEADDAVKWAFQQHREKYKARITNMKSTLGKSIPSFEVYMQWYVLFEELEKLLGKRLAMLYAYAVSHATDCPLCSTFFRKLIIDAGENPETMMLTREENKLLQFGSAIAQTQGHISDEVYHSISANYNEEEMVLLVAFAGQMIATNIFNNVIETEIDDYLIEYIAPTKTQ